MSEFDTSVPVDGVAADEMGNSKQSVFDRLSAELVAEIFTLAVDYHPLEKLAQPLAFFRKATRADPIVLSSVSSRWRSIAFSTRDLWTQLTLTFICTDCNPQDDSDHAKFLQEWVDRCGDSPILLRILALDSSHGGSVFNRPADRLYDRSLDTGYNVPKAFDVALAAFSRCNGIIINLENMQADMHWRLIKTAIEQGLPQLRILHISEWDKLQNLDLQRCSSLEVVDISRSNFNSIKLSEHQRNKLMSYRTCGSEEELHAILGAFPSLKHIVFNIPPGFGFNGRRPAQKLVSSELATFCLAAELESSMMTNESNLFDVFELPSLRHVAIQLWRCWGSMIWRAILSSSLRRCRPPLEQLELIMDDIMDDIILEDDLIQSLCELPTLKRLHLDTWSLLSPRFWVALRGHFEDSEHHSRQPMCPRLEHLRLYVNSNSECEPEITSVIKARFPTSHSCHSELSGTSRYQTIVRMTFCTSGYEYTDASIMNIVSLKRIDDEEPSTRVFMAKSLHRKPEVDWRWAYPL